MIASPSFNTPATDHLQSRFLALLPRIEHSARFYFRARTCAAGKADSVAETVAMCWHWFCRLAQRGKDASRFVYSLVNLAARTVKAGRRLCALGRGNDVLSFHIQQRHGFKVESLFTKDGAQHEPVEKSVGNNQDPVSLEERLCDNTQTPVPDQAAFRIDWPRFLESLCDRDQRLAAYLSLGNSARKAASAFGLSEGRIAQLRQKWRREWRRLEDVPASAQDRQCQATLGVA
jgi:hypothetical protein